MSPTETAIVAVVALGISLINLGSNITTFVQGQLDRRRKAQADKEQKQAEAAHAAFRRTKVTELQARASQSGGAPLVSYLPEEHSHATRAVEEGLVDWAPFPNQLTLPGRIRRGP